MIEKDRHSDSELQRFTAENLEENEELMQRNAHNRQRD